MTVAMIRVSGPGAEPAASELGGLLAGVDARVSEVEVSRSVEVVVLLSLGLNAVGAAKTVWDWWRERKDSGASVSIVMPDGSEIALGAVGLTELKLNLEPDVED